MWAHKSKCLTTISRKKKKPHDLARVVILLFSYSPPPRLIPHHHRPLSQGVDFDSFFGRFRVDFESLRVATQNRIKIDSKTTEKRLEIDSLGEGSVVVGDESGRWAVAEKQYHYARVKLPLCGPITPLTRLGVSGWTLTQTHCVSKIHRKDSTWQSEFQSQRVVSNLPEVEIDNSAFLDLSYNMGLSARHHIPAPLRNPHLESGLNS